MSRISSKNSTPERIVRSVLHRMGYRFRLHDKKLLGKPDLVFKKHNLVIFIHGCFWHRHRGCKRCTTPKSNQEYWLNKFKKNTSRDRKNQKKLIEQDWRVEVIWECETKNWSKLFTRLYEIFLEPLQMEKFLEEYEDEEIHKFIQTMGKDY